MGCEIFCRSGFVHAPLISFPTPLHVLRGRLEQPGFTEIVEIAGEFFNVTFPSEWPGDALVLFPRMAEALEENPDLEAWEGMVIGRATNVAVGQMGFKGPPDARRRVEIGYGINPSFEGRGYATEGVRALVAWAAEQPQVEQIVAECLESNVGSVRVLEKVGFERTGTRHDEEGCAHPLALSSLEFFAAAPDVAD